MSWDVRSVYYYLVCFATLLMLVFGGAQVVNHTLNLLLPREDYGPSSVELYERMRMRPVYPGQEQGGSTVDTLSEETLRRMAREEQERMHRMQTRNDVRSLLHSLALVLIAGPIYIYHWRRIRQFSDASGDAAERGTIEP